MSTRSVGWASSIDVLPLDKVVQRRGGYVAVRSPSNPSHYWGNFLLFDEPPQPGRRLSMGRALRGGIRRRASGPPSHVRVGSNRDRHGAARSEFGGRGYDLDESVALVARAAQLKPHPRQNRQVEVRALDAADGADVELWAAVVELQVEGRDPWHEEVAYRAFSRQRLDDLCALFRAGRGAWYVALDDATGTVVGSCGIVATTGRGRYQAVDTAAAVRRRGICSRLVVEAARRCAADYGAERFVIVADRQYHALGLYESLGFERSEHLFGACRWPLS